MPPGGGAAEQAAPFAEGDTGGLAGFVAGGAIGVLLGGQRHGGRIAVEQYPGHRHDDAGKAHDPEHPAPADRQHGDSEQRRGDRGAKSGGAIEHAGGKAAAAHVEPVPHHTGAGGELRRFAQAQDRATEHELAEIGAKAGKPLGELPQQDAGAQQAARPETVYQPSSRKLGKGIGPEEGREQQAHVRDRQMQVGADQRIADRQRGTVDVVHRAADHQQAQRGDLHPAHPRRRKLRRGRGRCDVDVMA
jgi:hypothetical protein